MSTLLRTTIVEARLFLREPIVVFFAVAFAVAGIYAWGYLRGRRDAYHTSALKMLTTFGLVIIIAQIISGDVSAHWVANNQPVTTKYLHYAKANGATEIGTANAWAGIDWRK